ncbi:Rieske (2Fe-2S) protein [Ekhidna sp.]|uniref:Rieske (2Fe-2S) protein n=1 Tax=Ekhidna sp. TaxID=2608089 RepID=UPI003C7DAE88
MTFKILDSKQKAEAYFEDGAPKLIRAGEKEVCLVRKGNEYFAFDNACPHMGAKLHQGNTNHLNEIVCPLHTYRFNMKSGEEANRRCKSMKRYYVHLNEGGLFIDC